MDNARLIFWETTKRCNLSCIHCRAVPVQERSSDELNFEEAKNLIDQIIDIAPGAILVLSGGEPLYREDIFDIAAYGKSKNLKVALATNGTLVTKEVAKQIRDSGISRVSISIDGADSKTHDAFRKIDGSFDAAIKGFHHLKDIGMSLQFNATIAKHNYHQLDALFEIAKTLAVDALHIFMLVPVGCGQTIPEEAKLSPQEYEKVLLWLYEKSKNSPLHLKATCAPQYFRIMRQKGNTAHQSISAPEHQRTRALAHSFTAQTKGCLAATGICFISHKGDVYPCGYLPVQAGNVREARFVDIWNNSEVFRSLRKPELLKGKCGVCEFVNICEGCRARAYAKTGNYLDEETECVYIPKQNRNTLKPWDFIDRNILNMIQGDFPTMARPYAGIARRIGISEEDAFLRVSRLKSNGTIRRIGGFFNSHKIGYKSILIGLEVMPEKIDYVGEIINRYPGVTHNYARKDTFNLWFTLTCKTQIEMNDVLEEISQVEGVNKILRLPTIKYFKLDVRFQLGDEESVAEKDDRLQPSGEGDIVLDQIDERLINILSKDLPLVYEPYNELALHTGIELNELFNKIERYKKTGVMRKFACILNHRSSGFSYNAMSVWNVPFNKIDEVGKLISSYKQISHCYARPTYPDWPYNLYAMIHSNNKDLCDAIAKEIASKADVKDYRLLYSEKEFKKSSMEYFAY